MSPDPRVRRLAPQPVEVDLARIAQIGIVLWALAALGCGVWWLVAGSDLTSGPALGLWICLAGVVLGFVGLTWARAHPSAGRN